MKVGYYIFLGYGDYHPSSTKSQIWVNTWSIETWKRFIDHLLELGVNTLLIYLNGHFLPYQSKIYPELVDENHPNCKKEFLRELLGYTKLKGIEAIGVITTTGHAGKFSSLNGDACIEIATIDSSIESTLVSFPDHLKKKKLEMQSGAAQLGYGVLCHNKESSQKYAINIISELISIYGDYFDGVALHPPESAYPCVCSSCQIKFEKKNGLQLLRADKELAREFFITSYMEFQNESLFPLIKKLKQKCNQLTFTIPWFFESSFHTISSIISKETVIIEWDYNLDPRRIEGLAKRLENYRSYGNSVWFMPSAGFSFSKETSLVEQINAVLNQIGIAEEVGVDAVVHFLGPKTSEFIDETSVKACLSQKTKESCSFR
jgi:hypothetical protein